jgi:polyisoprenoid-binding protein YceI
MQRIVLTLALLFVCSFAQADTAVTAMPRGTYKLDKAHASLIWKVSHLGLSYYTARFTRFDASYEFDPEQPLQSQLSVTVDPTSIETDYPNSAEKDFNKELAFGKNWFNAEAFPKIHFTSKKIEMTGENTASVSGELEFLGVKKPVVLAVTLNKSLAKQPFSGKPVMGFSATTTLKRSQWGMNAYVPNIGDDVQLLIEVEFAKA